MRSSDFKTPDDFRTWIALSSFQTRMPHGGGSIHMVVGQETLCGRTLKDSRERYVEFEKYRRLWAGCKSCQMFLYRALGEKPQPSKTYSEELKESIEPLIESFKNIGANVERLSNVMSKLWIQ